jgi:hypothetical protein
MIFIFSVLSLTHASKADPKYLSNIPIANVGGIDYRILSDSPTSFTSVINYAKVIGKYIVQPGNQASTLKGIPDSGTPTGYGWATSYNFSGPLPSGLWNFSTTVVSNKNDIGYLVFVVYKTCNGFDIKLFGTSTIAKVTDGSNVPKNYFFTYNAPYLDVGGCSLKIEYWLNVTSASLSNLANLAIVHGSGTWIQFPTPLDITPPAFSLNYTSSIIAGIPITHSLYWTDDSTLGGYIFSFDNGTGNFVNDSFVKFSGTSNWSNVTKTVSSTPGAVINWCVYTQDLAGNWNGTSCLNPFTYIVAQLPSLSIQKKVVESLVQQNKTFTVQILIQNIGGGHAYNVVINDSVQPRVNVVQGDTSWVGELGSSEGNGFIYTANATQQGYLDLGGAVATYLDAAGTTYKVTSNSVQLYVEATVVPPPPSIYDLLYRYSVEIQIVGGLVGFIVSTYTAYKLTRGVKNVRKAKHGKKKRRIKNKWLAIRYDFGDMAKDLKDILNDLKDVFVQLFKRK